MPMVRQWWLAKSRNRNVAIRMLVDRSRKSVSFEIVEDDEIDFDPSDGTMKRGSIACPICEQAPPEDHLKREGRAGRIGMMPMAVMFNRPNQTGKGYRPSNAFDLQKLSDAQDKLSKYLDDCPDALPSELIADHSSRAIFVHLYGIIEWGDLFNPRQALSLVTFVEKSRLANEKIRDETGDSQYSTAVATYLAMMVDRLADFNSTLCILNNVGGEV